MKKLLFIVMLSFLSIIRPCHADEMFDIGRSIGNAIGNSMGNAATIYRGNINKEFRVDKHFDVSQVKSFVVLVRPYSDNSYIQSDYITHYPYDVIADKLSEYNIKTAANIVDALSKINPNFYDMDFDSQYNEYQRFVRNNKDAEMYVLIHSYFQNGGNGSCDIEIKIEDTKTAGSPIFYFRESRLDVPNRQAATLAKNIMDSFVSKFKKTFSKQKEE